MNFPLPSLWLNLVTFSIALIPAAFTAWWGRALVRMADDPAIAERLAANRRRVIRVVAVTVAVLAVTRPHTLIWALPLLIISRAVAAFPTRRTLLGETWTLPQYLANGFRFYIALLGFWTLLGIGPMLARGGQWWIIGGLAALLFAWDHWHHPLLLRALRAQPLISESLQPRFAQVVERSKVGHPRVWRAGPPGAVIANAMALPSIKSSAVLFSETLLSRLSDEETTAIFAHEVAHLEHFDRARLRRLQLGNLSLILAGMALVPVTLLAAPQLLGTVVGIWPVVVLIWLLIRARRAQENEYASDRRALELCGDAGVLASALIKLHTIGRLPRRWESEAERSASHPSLARRLQAIRAVAQAPAAGLDRSELFAASEPGVYVAFDTDGLRYFQGVPPECSPTTEAVQASAGSIAIIRFSHIVELRVAAGGRAAPELLMVDRDGGRRKVQMRAEDLSRLQKTLDGVDALLLPIPQGPLGGSRLGSIAAIAAAICALLSAQLWSVVLVTLVAAWRPTKRLLLASATSTAAAAILVLSRHLTGVEHSLTLVAGTLPLVAVALWIRSRLAREHRDTEEMRLPLWLLWGLSLTALAAWIAPVVAAQGGFYRLTKTARTFVGATALPAAAAAVFAQTRGRLSRRLALLFAIAACVPVVIGTSWFRERVVRDPLLADLPEFTVTEASLKPVSRFVARPWASRLRVSPVGTTIAVSGGDQDAEDEATSEFTVYAKDTVVRSMVAIDLQFLDETRVVALNASPAGVALELLRPDDSKTALWTQTLAGVPTGRLAVAPRTGYWRVLGQTRSGTFMRFEGFIGQDAVRRTEWTPPATGSQSLFRGVAGSGPAALWIHQQYRLSGYGRVATLLASLSGGWPVESVLFAGPPSRASVMARSEAYVTCLDPPVGEDEPVCLASDSNRTNVFKVELPAGRSQAVGAVQGSFWASSLGNAGVVGVLWNGAPALLRLSERHVIRIPLPSAAASGEVACYSEMVGVVVPGDGQSIVTVYRLEEQQPIQRQ